MVRPIFEAWLGAVHGPGRATLTIRNTGGTDHLLVRRAWACRASSSSRTRSTTHRTHHSNMDVYDRIQAPT